MPRLVRLLLAIFILLLIVPAVSYLQYRFDQSDLHKAEQAVRQMRTLGPQDLSLEAKLVQFYHVEPYQLSWDTQLYSRCQGVVRVQAQLEGHTEDLIWEVDVISSQVKPVSIKALELGNWRAEEKGPPAAH